MVTLKSRLKTVAVGFLGGLVVSLIDRYTFQFGSEVAEINIVAATTGSVVFVLVFGVFPFLRVMVWRI